MYKALIDKLNSEILKPNGFSKKGEAFYLKKGDNYALINFQKSQNSLENNVSFTIDLGIYSGTLRVFDMFEIKLKPSISDCQWRTRIGFLLPDKQDYWWNIGEGYSFSDVYKNIYNLIEETVIPILKTHITDDVLEEEWRKGICTGISEQQRLLYLIGLIKFNGKDNLEENIHRLKEFSKGKPFSNNIAENLQKIGIN